MTFITLWYLVVEEDNFLKLKSASTSVVYELKYLANTDSHPTEETMVDQVVGEVFFVASTMSGIHHAVTYCSFGDNFKNCFLD
jgi:hypothetical protein